MNINNRTPDYIIELARELRQNMTESEKLLWEKLRKKQVDGYRFRRQHPVYRYVLDFYCYEKKLAIELDGDVHIQREEYDEYRDEFLKSTGIETLRFKNYEVVNDINQVLKKIKERLHLR